MFIRKALIPYALPLVRSNLNRPQRARHLLAMATIKSLSSMNSKKSKSQKKCRRRTTLMKKASEYSKMCDAAVCVGIRLRDRSSIYFDSR